MQLWSKLKDWLSEICALMSQFAEDYERFRRENPQLWAQIHNQDPWW